MVSLSMISSLGQAQLRCEELFAESPRLKSMNLDTTLRDLAELRLKLDRARARGKSSVVQRTLSHDYKVKENTIVSYLENRESMSRGEFIKRIEAMIQKIQTEERNRTDEQERQQNEKARQQQEEIRNRTLNPVVKDIIPDAIRSVFSPDGKALYVFSRKDQIRQLDSKTRVQKFEMQLPAHPESAVVSPDGNEILMGFIDRLPRSLNLTNRILRNFMPAPDYGHVALNADPKEVAIISGREVYLKSLTATVTSSIVRFENPVFKTMTTDDPSKLFVITRGKEIRDLSDHGVNSDCELHTVDAKTGKILSSFKINDGVNVAAISPDGHYLSTGTYESVFTFDIVTGLKINDQAFRDTEFRNEITSMVYLKDGKTLVTGSESGHIRFLDPARLDAVHVMDELYFYVSELTLSPDGRSLVATGEIMDQLLWIDLFSSPK
jgi:hypothetical protein